METFWPHIYPIVKDQPQSLGQCFRHGLFKIHQVSLFVCLFLCFFIQTPTQDALCMCTFGTLQVHSNTIWVSTALTMFAFKHKPLTVYLSLSFVRATHSTRPRNQVCHRSALVNFIFQTEGSIWFEMPITATVAIRLYRWNGYNRI